MFADRMAGGLLTALPSGTLRGSRTGRGSSSCCRGERRLRAEERAARAAVRVAASRVAARVEEKAAAARVVVVTVVVTVAVVTVAVGMAVVMAAATAVVRAVSGCGCHQRAIRGSSHQGIRSMARVRAAARPVAVRVWADVLVICHRGVDQRSSVIIMQANHSRAIADHQPIIETHMV